MPPKQIFYKKSHRSCPFSPSLLPPPPSAHPGRGGGRGASETFHFFFKYLVQYILYNFQIEIDIEHRGGGRGALWNILKTFLKIFR